MAMKSSSTTLLSHGLIGLTAIGFCAVLCTAVSAQQPAGPLPAALTPAKQAPVEPTTDTPTTDGPDAADPNSGGPLGEKPTAKLPPEPPLYEQDPYDQITLDAANNNEVLRVEPLDLPGRELPANPRPKDKLVVRLLEGGATDYEIEWRSIEKVELFEQLILDRANELSREQKFEESYDHFIFLLQHHPKLPGLAEGMQTYLWREAGAAHKAGQYDMALLILREVYGRNPNYPNLGRALGMATDQRIRHYEAQKNYAAIRELLGQLAAWFPKESVVVARSQQFERKAGALLASARSAVQKGDMSNAIRLSHEQQRIWPDVAGGKQFAESLHQRHPRIVVGVCMPGGEATPGHLTDFGARRTGRLMYRTLTEFAGPSTDGGRYESPLGTVKIEALESRMSIDLREGIGWASGQSRLSAHDVSRRLLAMADPRDAAYRIDWAEVLGTMKVRDVYGLDIQLHRAHVRPDAMLQTIVHPYSTPGAASGGSPSNGPYVIASRDRDQTVFLPNRQYFDVEAGQPVEIVERHYREGAQAIEALKKGHIRVLDRVNPWGLNVVREDPDLVVGRYGVPLVHCLVPNMRRPLTSRRNFRRALIYGIHREAIRSQLVGAPPPGSEEEEADENRLTGREMITGPFPRGMDRDDPIGYAYDESIHLRGYEPRLAMLLANISIQDVAKTLKEKGEKLEEKPRIVLAHPANEIVRSVCGSIRKQLERIGLQVTLREFSGPVPERIPDDVDLMYAALALWEPVVDARRVLGENGIAGGCSAYMSLALRQLDRTADWQETHKRLRRIHRVAHDDVAVVPLWQMTDYFAYHKSIDGIGPRPITLYQNIEQWRPALQYPSEER